MWPEGKDVQIPEKSIDELIEWGILRDRKVPQRDLCQFCIGPKNRKCMKRSGNALAAELR